MKKYSNTITLLPLLLVGGLLYFFPLFLKGGPLGDGGLFYSMASTLLQQQFHWAKSVTYNGQWLPFAYPPLGFYLAAGVTWITHLPLINIFQWLPGILTILHIPVFFALTKEIYNNPRFAISATFFFTAYSPRYEWLIYGGGIARSLSYFFFLLALFLLTRWTKNQRYREVFLCGVVSGIILLSHSGTAFAYFIITEVLFAYLWFQHKHNRRQIFLANILLLFTAFWVASLWWGRVLITDGIQPLLSALSTGHKGWYGVVYQIPLWPFAPLLFFSLPILQITGLVTQRYPKEQRMFYGTAIILFFLVTPRAPLRYSAPISAWLAQMGFESIQQGLRSTKTRAFFTAWVQISIVTIALIQSFGWKGLSSYDIEFIRSIQSLHLNKSTERIISFPMESSWGADFYNEWLPALTGMQVPLVVQGHEWSGDFFKKQQQREQAVQLVDKGNLQDFCQFLQQNKITLIWIHPDDTSAWIQRVFEALDFSLVLNHPKAGRLYRVDISKCPTP